MPTETALGQADTPGHRRRYCCYGCRWLGENGQKPAPTLPDGHAAWFKIAIGAVIAGQAMLLGLAINLAPPEGSTRLLLHLALIVSCVAVLAILGRPLLLDVGETVRRRQLSIELLFVVGVVGACAASLHSTLTGSGPVYYEVVALLLTVYSVGKTLGAQSRAKAIAESRGLRATFDHCQKILPDGSMIPVRVSEIRVGDRVRVLAGEPIPIDGMVVQGQAFICETPLTGEPFPAVRREGDPVFAGSYAEDGELAIEAIVSGTERRLDKVLVMLEDARVHESHLQKQADRIVRWFLPAVLTVAAGTFIFWTRHVGWGAGLFNAMAVLLVACPCAMGLATPIAIWNALAVLASRGLVARSGDMIDRLAELTLVVFDKTGTLSEESHSLIDVATVDQGEARQNTLTILAAVQERCAHPVARAFHSLANASHGISRFLRAGNRVKSLKTVPARGIEAWIELPGGQERHLRIGQRAFMTNLDQEKHLLTSLRPSTVPNNRDSSHPWAGSQLIYVQMDDKLEAVAQIRERLRSTTRATLAALEGLGIKHQIMTGDCSERALDLGLANIEGRLTPEDKAVRVEALRRSGENIGFVGDGINDAPALNVASVGVALAHGAGVTTASAGAVLYGADLRTVPWAIALCRQVRASIHSNLIFAAAYNTLGVILAASGFLHPVGAALLMVLSSFTVSWRALRSTDQAATCCAGLTLLEHDSPPRQQLRSVELAGDGNSRASVKAPRTWRWDVPRLETGSLGTPGRAGSIRWLYAAMILWQAPFLIYFLQLSPPTSAGVFAAFVGLSLVMAFVRPRNLEGQRILNMTSAMLSLGNGGMLLGWWMDSGFKPITLASPCCTLENLSLWASIVSMPGMNLGMLAAGLPPMLVDPANIKRGLNRWSLALLSATGMIIGMAAGNAFPLKVVGASYLPPPLVSFASMTIGMLLGMFFCCELGRAISLCLRHRG